MPHTLVSTSKYIFSLSFVMCHTCDVPWSRHLTKNVNILVIFIDIIYDIYSYPLSSLNMWLDKYLNSAFSGFSPPPSPLCGFRPEGRSKGSNERQRKGIKFMFMQKLRERKYFPGKTVKVEREKIFSRKNCKSWDRKNILEENYKSWDRKNISEEKLQKLR